VKRRLFLSAAAVGAAAATSGCLSGTGGSTGNTGTGASAAPSTPAGPIKLTFSSYAFQEPTVKATQDIVDSWNKANPTITVEYQKVDAASVHDKLVTQFAGGSAPDIIHDESADLAGFSAQGYLTDLGPLIPPALKSDVADSVWKAVTYGGKITGIPTIAQVYNVFVNTDLLAAAGIALPTADKPWTYDELAANAKKLTSGDNFGFAWGLKSPTAGIMNAGLAFGGTFVSGDEAKPTMKVGDAELELPKRIMAMIADKSMAPTSVSMSGTEVLPGFYAGKYAMVMAGNYVATQIKSAAPATLKWTMIPLLKGTSQNQAAGPQTLSIAKQSKYPQQAMAFIAHYMAAEKLAAVGVGDSLIPVTKSAGAIAAKQLGTTNGWDVILTSGVHLADAPWFKATKFAQWKSDIATPNYQQFLQAKIDLATLGKNLSDGWVKVNS
jgi:ABC-type glycerol-3-phosphate transport system substrate-binding protein